MFDFTSFTSSSNRPIAAIDRSTPCSTPSFRGFFAVLPLGNESMLNGGLS